MEIYLFFSVVKIDLLADYFVPGKKNYERVRWCVTDQLQLKFDFLLTWVPPGAVYSF